MSNSIIIHESEELINLYGLNLNIFLGLDVISKPNAAEAIELLNLIQFSDVILLQAEVGNEKTYTQIKNWIAENDKEIPVVIIDVDNKGFDCDLFIQSDTDIKKAIISIAKLMGIKASNLNKNVASEFYPVPISYFPLMEKAFCDIYYRSAKTDPGSDSVYMKLYSANKAIDQVEVEKLHNQGSKNLYIPSSLRVKFAHFYTQMIVEEINADKSREKKYKALEGARKVVAQEIKKYGVNEKVIKITNAAIENIFQDLSREKSLKKYLDFLKNNTESSLFQLSQMTNYLGFKIIENIDWGTQEQKRKITFAAFFHDITLDNDHLGLIHNQYALADSGLSDEEIQSVNNHALEASKLLRKYPEIPHGVDLIIKQHHGSHNGVGFQDPPAHDISPLAAVFMVAESFSSILVNNDGEFNVDKICSRLERTFPNHHKFLNGIEALRNITY